MLTVWTFLIDSTACLAVTTLLIFTISARLCEDLLGRSGLEPSAKMGLTLGPDARHQARHERLEKAPGRCDSTAWKSGEALRERDWPRVDMTCFGQMISDAQRFASTPSMGSSPPRACVAGPRRPAR